MTGRRALLALSAALLAAPLAHAAPRDGAALYHRHCAGCHGPQGRGDGPDARFLREKPRDLHDGVLQAHDVDALVRRIREGQPLAVTSDPRALDAVLRDSDALTDHLERLSRTDPWVIREGQALWADRCESCHGPYGTPLPEDAEDMPVDLADPATLRRYDAAGLREAVRHGVPGMPALEPPLDARDVETLAAYVRLLSPGLALYARVCAGCHGSDGRPVDLPPGLAQPRVAFDGAWRAGTTRQERETAVWHMLGRERPQMPHVAEDVDTAQVRAIVVWLRAQP